MRNAKIIAEIISGIIKNTRAVMPTRQCFSRNSQQRATVNTAKRHLQKSIREVDFLKFILEEIQNKN